ncbi:hypothetical protein BKA67DRAFT_582517 [Truncatella angustata]|uniref:LysM domain-containing protein n=1 Tax=Truncatella angustata TaxID=152316 RepID=A0A9P8RH01_9PEZI|nr:uncharacterized protein BKA67DRAFT_582517 [Truncatella angustata]KAH6645843.1 hypothetical protein BKA67DRAFT_582517 [Truncatella angustata]KAH8201987.1 hypothetical protein TruAng_003830 [Truncatella angustata]
MGNIGSTLAPLPAATALQTPYNTNCAVWYTVKPGDDCESLAGASCMDVGKLQSLNPALGGGECNPKLWAGYSYCVRAVGDMSPCGFIAPTPTPTCPVGYICYGPGESGCPTDRYCKTKLVTGPVVTSTTLVIVTAAPIQFTTL